jgi:endonuclease G
MRNRHLLGLAAAAILFFASCKKEGIEPIKAPEQPTVISPTELSRSGAITENFESGTKTAYAIANVTLSSGSWSFDEALIGNSTSDRKTGSQSARIRNTGILNMNFDVDGASTVTINHAVYGTDGSSTWQLWVSTNGGSSYSQVGSTVTSSSTTLQSASFTINNSANLRLSIRKVSGGTNRINIDDVVINAIATGPILGDDDNMLMGNPSNATTSIVSTTNYLMDRLYYKSSYHRDRGTANWVSWHIKSSDLGSTPRQDDFRADGLLPSGWYQVGSTSYSGSGFDRGHMCPSADRTASVAANSSTFLMTNMIPQAPNNNQQTWANLETYERDLVNAGNEVYIICGSYGIGGTGSNGGTTSTINSGHVTVPSNVWKVIVVIPNGNNDLSRVTTSTRVIAINTPNINSINSNWRNYRVTVNSIEAATGYDILSSVPTSVQNVIEAVVDNL